MYRVLVVTYQEMFTRFCNDNVVPATDSTPSLPYRPHYCDQTLVGDVIAHYLGAQPGRLVSMTKDADSYFFVFTD